MGLHVILPPSLLSFRVKREMTAMVGSRTAARNPALRKAFFPSRLFVHSWA